jgi:hypothetical protein
MVGISHAHPISLFICNCCPDDIRRAGLTVYGKPAPRESGGNTFSFVFSRLGIAKTD